MSLAPSRLRRDAEGLARGRERERAREGERMRERETTQRRESIELVKILVLRPRYLGEHGLLELRQRLTLLLSARDCF